MIRTILTLLLSTFIATAYALPQNSQNLNNSPMANPAATNNSNTWEIVPPPHLAQANIEKTNPSKPVLLADASNKEDISKSKTHKPILLAKSKEKNSTKTNKPVKSAKAKTKTSTTKNTLDNKKATPKTKSHPISHTKKTATKKTKPVKVSLYGLNITKIEKITGLKGQADNTNQAYKILAPRNDLKITVNGAQITPDMGLTSWISFKKTGDQTTILGDLILTPDQIHPVMGVALSNGIKITALNSHFLWESPRVVSMRIEGTGKEEVLADTAGKLFTTINSTRNGDGDLPLAQISPESTTLNPKKLSNILGVNGTFKDGVYKISVGKDIPIDTDDDNDEDANTNTKANITAKTAANTSDIKTHLNTWAAFMGSDKEAVVNGDFVINEDELQKVLVSLHSAGIYIMGIHQHMTGSDPHFVSLRFWGVGTTKTLAKGIRTALDATKEPVKADDEDEEDD